MNSDLARSRKITILVFTLLAVLILAAGARLLPLAILQKPLLNIMRFYELSVLLLFAPVAVLLLWRLLCTVGVEDLPHAQSLFILGAFLIGAGFGMHEPMNILPAAGPMSESVRASVRFFDDDLGHWLFFAGFMALTLAVVWAETRKGIHMTMKYYRCILVAAGVTGIIIALNMYRERTALDITILLLIMIMTLVLRQTGRRLKWTFLPITVLVLVAGSIGTALPLLHWLMHGYPG